MEDDRLEEIKQYIARDENSPYFIALRSHVLWLIAEVDRMRGVLMEYADQANWYTKEDRDWIHNPQWVRSRFGYDLARKALSMQEANRG